VHESRKAEGTSGVGGGLVEPQTLVQENTNWVEEEKK